MPHFIPTVTEQDVERILQRDFPEEHHGRIRELIEKIEVTEKWRVVAACLKISGGDLKKIQVDLGYANGFWRESIYEAEYPKVKKVRNLTKEQIEEKQKNQYMD